MREIIIKFSRKDAKEAFRVISGLGYNGMVFAGLGTMKMVIKCPEAYVPEIGRQLCLTLADKQIGCDVHTL